MDRLISMLTEMLPSDIVLQVHYNSAKNYVEVMCGTERRDKDGTKWQGATFTVSRSRLVAYNDEHLHEFLKPKVAEALEAMQ